MAKRKKQIIFGLINVTILLIGFYLGHTFWTQRSRGLILRQPSENYDFIDPIIACEVATTSDFPELLGLQKEFQSIVNNKKANGSVSALSIYFRGLKSGRWIELNGEEQYHPASLLKTLTAIAHYKLGEENPNHFNELVHYSTKASGEDAVNNITATEALKNGAWYSVAELVRQLLVHSDNNASNALIDNVTPSYLLTLYDDLGIPKPDKSGTIFISPKNYSIVFRVLFGATYLDRNDSEEVLKILTQTTYNDGLVKNLPKEVSVAHKFGFRNLDESVKAGDEEELHDCGIIYFPNHPYFLCVMTRGSSYQSLADTIAQVSKTAYDWQTSFWANRSPAK